jgi:hypothetical protein
MMQKGQQLARSLATLCIGTLKNRIDIHVHNLAVICTSGHISTRRNSHNFTPQVIIEQVDLK